MKKTIIETRTASTDEELTVNLMADELHARGADLSSKASVVSTLTEAEFRADQIEQLCESAALTAWRHYGSEADEWRPWADEQEDGSTELDQLDKMRLEFFTEAALGGVDCEWELQARQ